MQRTARYVLVHFVSFGLVMSVGCTKSTSTNGVRNPFGEAVSNVDDNEQSRNSVRDNVEQQIAMARSLEKVGQLQEAIDEWETIRQKFLDQAEPYHRLAILHDKTGQAKLAEALYERAIVLDDKNAEILCDYGYSRFLVGDLDRSEELLRQSISMQPDLARAHNNLGLVYACHERYNDAKNAFAQAGCNREDAVRNLNYAVMWQQNPEEAERHLEMAAR